MKHTERMANYRLNVVWTVSTGSTIVLLLSIVCVEYRAEIFYIKIKFI